MDKEVEGLGGNRDISDSKLWLKYFNHRMQVSCISRCLGDKSLKTALHGDLYFPLAIHDFYCLAGILDASN